MADDGNLYAYEMKGFWMDIGQPKDFLHGMSLYLKHLRCGNKDALASGPSFVGNVLVVSSGLTLFENLPTTPGVMVVMCGLCFRIRVQKLGGIVK